MFKKILLVFILSLLLVGCTQATTETTPPTTFSPTTSLISTTAGLSPCRDTPLADGCYVPSGDLNHLSPIPNEYVVSEDFETDRVGQIPRNWLLYTNPEYKPNGVYARVVEEEDNKYVMMYSDGREKPPYPQQAATPTFIFTTKFNLDLSRKGVAYADLMVPDEEANALSFGVSTGAVNVISVTINTDYSLFTKVGGPFFYYSANADSGDYYTSGITVTPNTWVRIKLTWDADLDRVQAFLIEGETETMLVEQPFHRSNRFNARPGGAILVPNVVKITMPYAVSGYGFVDNVIVEEVNGS
jgi:hypothetical protein